MGIYTRTEMEEILKRYGDTVYRMAFIQVKNRDTADDIYQDVWMKLLRQKSRIEPEEHLKAWLLRTCVSCCKDYWKSAWIRRVSTMVYAGEEEAVDGYGGHSGYDGDDDAGYLTECVRALPEKYRTIIHLYYYEDYSQKEIADMLHMKENTVASRMARGRERLKRMLEEGEEKGYEFSGEL